MNKKVDLKSILILDDDVEFRKLLKSLLSEYFQGVEFYEYDPVEKGEPADGFDWSKFDVLILDYYLCVHGLNGLDLFQKNRIKANFPPTIMLTGAGNEELAIRVLKSGIKDYIRKDKLNTAMLAEAITNAYEENHVERNEQGKLQEVNAEIAREINQLRRMKSEAEEQVQKGRAEHSTEVAALKAQLESLEEEKQTYLDAADEVQRMKSEAEEQVQKGRAEHSIEVATLKAQLEGLEEEKQTYQDAADDVQRIRSEADEQIRKERTERSTEFTAFKAKL
ncbi:MAG: response regulator, partial [Proteobacteria bacterium]|nr:response regulator [Pseudomonadota bacterium]